jgi:predicted ATPase
MATPVAIHRAFAEAYHAEIPRRLHAKSLELRAAMPPSRLRQLQGKRDEARELLSPIYGWFNEGFDTADLQESPGVDRGAVLSPPAVVDDSPMRRQLP